MIEFKTEQDKIDFFAKIGAVLIKIYELLEDMFPEYSPRKQGEQEKKEPSYVDELASSVKEMEGDLAAYVSKNAKSLKDFMQDVKKEP